MAVPKQAPGGIPAYPGLAPAGPPTWYPQYQTPFYEVDKRRGIDRTKTGLLLLVIGFLIGWIPFVSIIGFILELIGALFVILGRHAFGREHSRNVLWSIVFFIVGVVAAVVAIFIVIFSAIAANLRSFNQTSSPTFQPSLFDPTSFFIGTFIGTLILQISYVLLTFALQKRNGRILLLAGYAATIDSSIVNFFILRSNILLSALPSLAPALLYGYGYYLARKRIVLGEIPGPSPTPPPPISTGSIPN